GRHIGEEAIGWCDVCLAAGPPPFAPRALIASPLFVHCGDQAAAYRAALYRIDNDWISAGPASRTSGRGTLRAKSGCGQGFMGWTLALHRGDKSDLHGSPFVEGRQRRVSPRYQGVSSVVKLPLGCHTRMECAIFWSLTQVGSIGGGAIIHCYRVT